MEERASFVKNKDKRILRLTRSADQLAEFKLKKKKKCKHKEIICHIPLPVPPRISVWTILNEEYANKIKKCPMSTKKDIIRHICDVIYNKKKERRIMRALYYEVLRFCLKRNYPSLKIATLFGMYHATHQFFTTSLWHDFEETYEFFKETVFVHSINDPPESVPIFTLVDVKAILQRFVSLYLPVLPLLRETVLPNVRLWMYWHECKPEVSHEGKEIDMSGCTFDPNIFTGRSDWDPWEILEGNVLEEQQDQDRTYVYDPEKLDLSMFRLRGIDEVCSEEENTDSFEAETEENELNGSEGQKDFGKEENEISEEVESQDIVD